MDGRPLSTSARPMAPPGPWHVSDLSRYLLGDWKLDRVVRHRGEPAAYSFHGDGRFLLRPGGTIDYEEIGEIERLGARFEAQRRYVVTDVDGPRGQVLFADGRLFYDLDLARGQWRTRHQCDEDCYLFSCSVRGPNEFSEHWTVIGPTKTYRSSTVFVRVSD